MAAYMSCRERLWAAIQREEVDRVPCSPWLREALPILYDDHVTDPTELALRAAREGEIGLDPFFLTETDCPNVIWDITDDADGLPGVRITLDVLDDGPCDLVTRTFETPAGRLRDVRRRPKPGHLEYGLQPNPAFPEHLVKGPEDLDAMRYLVPAPSRFDVGAGFRRMLERVGDLGMVKPVVRSVLDHQAGSARAVEDLMVDYYENRPFFDAMMRIWQEKMMAETRAFLEAGARIIFGSWYFASLSVGWGPRIYRDAFLPILKAQVELVHSFGALYDYYDDGKLMGLIDMLAEAGVDVLETLCPPPVGDIDLAEVKRRIGDRTCLWGYGDMLYVIKMGTPADVDAMVRYAMETAGPRGFVMSTSDSIREGTPRANVRAYFEAARKYGRIRGRA